VKRFALLGMLVALVGAGAASAHVVATASDGTLTVKNADGRVVINAKGGVIGRFGQGSVTIKDPVPGDGTGPIVTGAEVSQSISDTTTVYRGTDVRFRILGGKFSITVVASNIQLSAVGTGDVKLVGTHDDTEGTYSLNGGAPQPFPDFQFTFTLTGTAPQGGAGG
jgi:hypothetical protein